MYSNFSYTLITLVILHTAFGLIWTTPWPDEKDLFLKFLFRKVQKVPYEILNSFLTRYTNFFFALHFHYTGDTAYRVWFELDNSLSRWKKNCFLSSQEFAIREIRQIRYENPIFFLGKLYRKNFLLYNLITLVILHTEFGLIWKFHWTDEND